MEPQIRFCTSADGTRIAYATMGEGPPLVLVPPWGENVELDWEHPDARGALQSLIQRRQYVTFCRRGVGASQREVDDFSLEAQVADVAAVVDHLGLDRFDLWGCLDGAAVSVAYAAQNPQRLSRLVLWAPYPCGVEIVRPGAGRAVVELVRGNWILARRVLADLVVPSGSTDLRDWASNYFRKSVSPEVAAKYVEFFATVDVRPFLPQVTVPTLVLHRRGDRNAPISAGRAAAKLIPDARFVALEGDYLNPFFGDSSYVETMIQFLDEGREQSLMSEVLPEGTAVILFADIADSTALTERLGDTAFRARARELDTALRRIIREAGGAPVEGKLLGDGVLAVFTSARQAIEAALGCGSAGDGAGLPLHLGIHAGDVIREEDPDGRANVYGGAVNIAARIAAASAPGEVLVSDTVRGLARTSAGVSFEDSGEHELKGVAEPQRLFAVRAQSAGS